MKQLLVIVIVLFISSFSFKDGLSKKEKKFATTSLEQTRDDLLATVATLNENQFEFSPGEGKWSVKGCLQHIAMSEAGIWKLCESTLKAAPNPEKRSEIKITDEQLLKMITDRSFKAKTIQELMPENSPYTTALDALNAFKENRNKLIKYVKNSKDDMRNHIAQTPLGMMDAYQMILLISGHSNRHTQQIAEVMADPNFPKN